MKRPAKVAVIGESEIAERITLGYEKELPSNATVIYSDDHRHFNDNNIKLVEICLPPEQRAHVVKGALEAGKHVSALGPISADIATIMSLHKQAKSRGLVLRSLNLSDYHKAFRRGTEMVMDDEIGEVQMIRVRWLASKLWESISIENNLLPPLGAFSLALQYGGNVKAVHANAGPKASAVMLKYEAPGKFGIIDASYTADLKIPGDWHENIQVEATGIDGALWANGYSPSLTDEPPLMMHRGPETISIDADLRLNADHAFRAAARKMIKTFFGKKRKRDALPGTEFQKVHALAVAARKSAETGNEVPIVENQ